MAAKKSKKDMSPEAVLSRRGKRNKRKGRDFEKYLAERVAETFDLPVTDVWNSRSGRKECDIQLSAAAYEVFPYHIEAKNQRSLSVPAWLRQAEADAATVGSEGRPVEATPVVVFKQHGSSRAYAIIDFEVFLGLVKAGS